MVASRQSGVAGFCPLVTHPIWNQSPPTTLRRPDADLPTYLYLPFRSIHPPGTPPVADFTYGLYHLYHGIRAYLCADLHGTQRAPVLASVRSIRWYVSLL